MHFYHCGIVAIQRLLQVIRKVVDEFYVKFLRDGISYGQQTFNFGVVPGHDLDPQSFNRSFYILAYIVGQVKNFADQRPWLFALSECSYMS